jgi:hypothetical protein
LGGHLDSMAIFDKFYHEKMSFRPSNWPQNLKTTKNSKLPENCFEPIGKGGWPPISTWINPPSLLINFIHCVECPHQMTKFLFNLARGEPLALV